MATIGTPGVLFLGMQMSASILTMMGNIYVVTNG